MDSRRNVLFACGALRILFCILSGAWFISGVTGTLIFYRNRHRHFAAIK